MQITAPRVVWNVHRLAFDANSNIRGGGCMQTAGNQLDALEKLCLAERFQNETWKTFQHHGSVSFQ